MHKNPFGRQDSERHEIWNMLVKRDIEAFVRKDWSMIANDFIEENFMGIDAKRNKNPDAWKLSFPSLKAYKTEWLKQAREFKNTEWKEDIEDALYKITILRDIEIQNKSALAHKIFFGHIQKANGEWVSMNWQTLYRCRKISGVWKIAGFCGYLPHFSSSNETTSKIHMGKKIPPGVTQHQTAGPYSPLLVVNPGQLVVISGQAAIDQQGMVVGNTIEEQTAYTLENCQKQLRYAGCDLNDVFKVTVYLNNLDDWARFNKIYRKYFDEPLPVRTAVQTGLLMTLQVEIEMWAVKP